MRIKMNQTFYIKHINKLNKLIAHCSDVEKKQVYESRKKKMVDQAIKNDWGKRFYEMDRIELINILTAIFSMRTTDKLLKLIGKELSSKSISFLQYDFAWNVNFARKFNRKNTKNVKDIITRFNIIQLCHLKRTRGIKRKFSEIAHPTTDPTPQKKRIKLCR